MYGDLAALAFRAGPLVGTGARGAARFGLVVQHLLVTGW